MFVTQELTNYFYFVTGIGMNCASIFFTTKFENFQSPIRPINHKNANQQRLCNHKNVNQHTAGERKKFCF